MTGPARRVRDRMRSLLRSPAARWRDRLPGFLFPGDPGSGASVREPRRPKRTPPSDAMALQIPRDHSARD